ncbi:MAG: biotin--[acetyl-CoA-carboxylase] ligase [Eubacteriales bacterium]
MKTKILKLLRERETHISGQELCEIFQVSRTAIWKVMNQLKEDGYEIEAIQNKGYRLKREPDILTESELKSRFSTKWIGEQVVCVKEVGSTNQELKKLAEEEALHGTLYIGEQQVAGRGRRGREWESDTGENITMSLLLRPDFNPDLASRLTLVMAISVAKALEEVTGLSCMIKWPNDILIREKKVCGILTEMSAEMGFIHYVVIGVGINVNHMNIPKHLEEIATSIQKEMGRKCKRTDIIVRTMEYFEEAYETFCQTYDVSEMLDWYNDHLLNKNSMVRVLLPEQEYEAKAIGINEKGELQVERDDGMIENIYAGEVSVRGITGYV